jgi:hypothetical protein
MIILSVLLMLAASTGVEGEAMLSRLAPGSALQFEIDKVYPNPMANGGAIITSVNIPDSVDVTFTLGSTSGDTLATERFLDVAPGRYRISWDFTHSHLLTGRYVFEFQAKSKGGYSMYCYRVPVLVLTEQTNRDSR